MLVVHVLVGVVALVGVPMHRRHAYADFERVEVQHSALARTLRRDGMARRNTGDDFAAALVGREVLAVRCAASRRHQCSGTSSGRVTLPRSPSK